MLVFEEELEAYVCELEDVYVCWDEEPEDDYEEVAISVRNAYINNIKHIAETIYEEVKNIFNVENADEVISKIGKPHIFPDNGQVEYTESLFDSEHLISFEYLDDTFDDIQYVSVDG